ncbi:MAG: hypothetical protein ACXV3C_09130, partial [Actinomycetes bacterium]
MRRVSWGSAQSACGVFGTRRRRTGGGWSVFGHPWAWGLLAAETAAVIHAAPRILTVLVERMTQVSS